MDESDYRAVVRARRLLRVTEGDDDGVIDVYDDRGMRSAPLGVVSGAVMGAVTPLSSGWRDRGVVSVN